MVSLEKAFPLYLDVLDGKAKPKFRKNKASLEKKIDLALVMLEDCELCERTCGVNRTDGEKGYCHAGDKISISGRYVGRNNDLESLTPSYDVFFLGCVLKCVFCQNPDTSQVIEPREGITEKHLAKIIDSRLSPKIVNFVGGDPLPQLPFVLKTLNHIQKDIPKYAVLWDFFGLFSIII